MQIRRVAFGRGLTWLTDSLDLAGKRPGAALGAALLALVLVFGVMVLAVAALAPGLHEGGSVGSALRRMLPLALLMLALQPVLLAGLMQVLRRIDSGHGASAFDVFSAFRGGRLLPLASLGLIQVAALGLNLLALQLLGGDDFLTRYWAFFENFQAGRGFDPGAVPEPDNAALLSLINLALNYFATVALVFAVPQVMFAGRDPLTAVREALRAGVVNLPALLLTAVILIIALVVAILVIGLLMTLAGLVGRLIAPAVGQLLAFGVFGFSAVAIVAMLAGAAYLAWRDIFDGDADATQSQQEVEAEL